MPSTHPQAVQPARFSRLTPTALASAATLAGFAPLSQAAFIEDSSATFETRNMYFNRDFRDGTSAQQSKRDEWAQGFMLNLQSGYTEGTVGFGLDALGMLGVKLDSSPDRTGTGLLPTHDDGRAANEYSKLGLEHFTPDYTRYFHGLAEPVRDRLVAAQWQLHKGIDADTTAAIHDELYRRTLDRGWPDTTLTPGVHVRTAGRIAATQVELHLEHEQQKTRSRLTTDAVVLATGHRERTLGRLLAGLDPYMRRDSSERPRVDDRHRLVLDPSVTGSVYVQNAETHTHGVGTPDLGLAAWRSATILNDLTGREPYPLPARTAFTTFGLDGGLPQIPSARHHRALTPLVDGI